MYTYVRSEYICKSTVFFMFRLLYFIPIIISSMSGKNCKFCPLTKGLNHEWSYELIVDGIMQLALNLSTKFQAGKLSQKCVIFTFICNSTSFATIN